MEPPGNTVGDLRETGPMYNNIFHETYYSYTNVKKIGSSGVRVEECMSIFGLVLSHFAN